MESESIYVFSGIDIDGIIHLIIIVWVYWYKCPFTRHNPLDIGCDFSECEDDWYWSEDKEEYPYDRVK